MDNRAIGVFDSGLGGLTVVKELHKILPNESILYLGDTGRIPYGTRSRETIIRYTQQDIAFLLRQQIKLIVAACGTVSSTFPKSMADALPVPYIDVVLPAAQQACALSRGRIGVIGTPATMRSNSYGKVIHNIRGDLRVYGNACPLLVHLVENGMIQPDNPITRMMVQMYLQPLVEEQIDTLILGCTHYPIIYPIFNQLLNYQVKLVDPGQCAARYVKNYLCAHHLLGGSGQPASTRYFVTDDVEGFSATASLFLGAPLDGEVALAELETERNCGEERLPQP